MRMLALMALVGVIVVGCLHVHDRHLAARYSLGVLDYAPGSFTDLPSLSAVTQYVVSAGSTSTSVYVTVTNDMSDEMIGEIWTAVMERVALYGYDWLPAQSNANWYYQHSSTSVIPTNLFYTVEHDGCGSPTNNSLCAGLFAVGEIRRTGDDGPRGWILPAANTSTPWSVTNYLWADWDELKTNAIVWIEYTGGATNIHFVGDTSSGNFWTNRRFSIVSSRIADDSFWTGRGWTNAEHYAIDAYEDDRTCVDNSDESLWPLLRLSATDSNLAHWAITAEWLLDPLVLASTWTGTNGGHTNTGWHYGVYRLPHDLRRTLPAESWNEAFLPRPVYTNWWQWKRVSVSETNTNADGSGMETTWNDLRSTAAFQWETELWSSDYPPDGTFTEYGCWIAHLGCAFPYEQEWILSIDVRAVRNVWEMGRVLRWWKGTNLDVGVAYYRGGTNDPQSNADLDYVKGGTIGVWGMTITNGTTNCTYLGGSLNVTNFSSCSTTNYGGTTPIVLPATYWETTNDCFWYIAPSGDCQMTNVLSVIPTWSELETLGWDPPTNCATMSGKDSGWGTHACTSGGEDSSSNHVDVSSWGVMLLPNWQFEGYEAQEVTR